MKTATESTADQATLTVTKSIGNLLERSDRLQQIALTRSPQFTRMRADDPTEADRLALAMRIQHAERMALGLADELRRLPHEHEALDALDPGRLLPAAERALDVTLQMMRLWKRENYYREGANNAS